jgi:O-acetyl-ADP-ribose deacetylase (regulator of RNase III)
VYQKSIGKRQIILSQGDISECDTDAIVNAANNHLWMGVGVAVVTGAGALRTRYVIHAAGMGADLITSKELIGSCAAASLRCAEALSLCSIAFPAIGTGVGGFPLSEAARIMFKVAAAHLSGGSGSLQKIEFILFGQADYEAFKSVLEEIEV